MTFILEYTFVPLPPNIKNSSSKTLIQTTIEIFPFNRKQPTQEEEAKGALANTTLEHHRILNTINTRTPKEEVAMKFRSTRVEDAQVIGANIAKIKILSIVKSLHLTAN